MSGPATTKGPSVCQWKPADSLFVAGLSGQVSQSEKGSGTFAGHGGRVSAAIDTAKSRTQVRNECKENTYLVMQRSDAWGRLLHDCFPGALRLSIHPQSPHAEKIGIRLGEASDVWITPWHGVAVECAGKFKLMRLSEAEDLG